VMPLHISLVGRNDLSVEIYRQVRDAIVNGILRPGDRLPASRELAAALNVSRMTVTVAYDRLAGDSFVVARVGDGTFVNPHAVRVREGLRRQPDGVLRPRPLWQALPLPAAFRQPASFDFRTGHPDASLFPHTTWRRLVARTLRDASRTGTSYGDPAGEMALRAAIARHVSMSRGVIATAEDVTITNGTQQALDVLARVLLAPSDRVAVEDPGYNPPRRLFHSLGARVTAVGIDDAGIVVEAIPRHVRAVYVTPSHQYPTGVLMTLPRRQALLAWAERQNAAIIEDDYDSEFRFSDRPLEPLRTLDTAGRVIYVGSFSKTLLPSLRLGFIIAPRSLQEAIHRAKFLTDWHSPTVLQAALARFIEEGDFARHLRRVNSVYRERHEIVAAALAGNFADDLELIPSTTGLHMAAVARTASVEQIEAIARRGFAASVAIQTLAYFSAGARPRAGIVVGYGAIATAHIMEGLRRLRKCFRGSAKH
jgi:GntR family transcriptional regulator / MocR family aminotransferase